MKKLMIFLTLVISIGFTFYNTTVYATDIQQTREKWVYGPYSGYYYVIYMKEGVVEKVESVRHDDQKRIGK